MGRQGGIEPPRFTVRILQIPVVAAVPLPQKRLKDWSIQLRYATDFNQSCPMLNRLHLKWLRRKDSNFQGGFIPFAVTVRHATNYALLRNWNGGPTGARIQTLTFSESWTTAYSTDPIKTTREQSSKDMISYNWSNPKLSLLVENFDRVSLERLAKLWIISLCLLSRLALTRILFRSVRPSQVSKHQEIKMEDFTNVLQIIFLRPIGFEPMPYPFSGSIYHWSKVPDNWIYLQKQN